MCSLLFDLRDHPACKIAQSVPMNWQLAALDCVYSQRLAVAAYWDQFHSDPRSNTRPDSHRCSDYCSFVDCCRTWHAADVECWRSLDYNSDTEQDNDLSNSSDSDWLDFHNFGSFVDSDSCAVIASSDGDFVLNEFVDYSSSCSECEDCLRSFAVDSADSFGG